MGGAPDIRLTAEWIATALHGVHGSIVGGVPAVEFTGVSIDTRTIAKGELFVAIRGERFDGADFVAAALEAGAGGVMVERGRGAEAAAARGSVSRVVFEVDDTTGALQALARTVRRESGTKVVAITGSAGKTTTKEATSDLLSSQYRVVRNRGNLNNHIGLPLSLMALRHRPEIAVVELGMNHAGEISTLVGIAEPEVRVWTNVGEAHLGFFGSLDAIADAKAEILERADRSSLLVANADDRLVAERTPRFAGRTRTFGIDRDADVRATDVEDRGIDGIRARVTTPAGTFDLQTPLVGTGNLANVLAATAVAIEFQVPLPTIAERAKALQPAAHRGEILRLASGVTIIDDSYNANPTATRRALDVLARAASGRRIAVLGEMLELGAHAEALHADVGRAAAGAGVALLVTVGGAAAEAMAVAAVAAGMPTTRVLHLATSVEAAEAIVPLVEPGDYVLVKGSRGVRTDVVVERLRAERG